MNLYFKQIQIGGYDRNFSYIIGDADSKKVAVVDPDNLPLIEEIIAEEELEVVAVLLTHSHFDHVAGCQDLAQLTGATVYLHKHNFHIESLNGKLVPLSDGDQIKLGAVTLTAMETFGHTQDSICYLLDAANGGPKLITGDTLFINGCGRCDLPGGNVSQMYDSLHRKILSLPAETEIYPGHDYGHVPFDTLQNQKSSNKYLACSSEEEFINIRS